MDPQHRLLLEVSWEALEDAGINPKQLKGTATGVFMGVMTHDYHNLVEQYVSERDIGTYQVSGNATCILTGRISYFLGLNGPSFPVDTACSSSLVALHLACHSLRTAESNLALVGGVILYYHPT